jgi:hypothetical protein
MYQSYRYQIVVNCKKMVRVTIYLFILKIGKYFEFL